MPVPSAAKIPVRAERLRELRLQRELTQAQLAKKAGLSARALNFKENGQDARLDTIKRLATALGCDPWEIAYLPQPSGVVNEGTHPPLPIRADGGEAAEYQALPPVAPLMVGRRQVLTELKDRLGIRTEGLDKPSGLILVHGWPGVGKSTLAAELAYDDDVSALFEAVLWVQLGPNPNIDDALRRWGQALKLPADRLSPKATACDAIRRELRQRRALLIIDDVWTADHALTFLLGGAQMAAVVTTRERQIADLLAPFQIDAYSLPVLEPDEALALLGLYVPVLTRDHAELSRDLVAALEYLPLSIVVAGQLLKRRQLRDAADIIDALRAVRDDRGELFGERVPFVSCGLPDAVRLTVAGVLHLSVRGLTGPERKCFLSLEPMRARPAKFSLSTLASYWETDAAGARQTAGVLVDHGLMEPAGEGLFQMHALLLDYAKYLGDGQ